MRCVPRPPRSTSTSHSTLSLSRVYVCYSLFLSLCATPPPSLSCTTPLHHPLALPTTVVFYRSRGSRERSKQKGRDRWMERSCESCSAPRIHTDTNAFTHTLRLFGPSPWLASPYTQKIRRSSSSSSFQLPPNQSFFFFFFFFSFPLFLFLFFLDELIDEQSFLLGDPLLFLGTNDRSPLPSTLSPPPLTRVAAKK